MICNACGHENADTSAFCANCGTQLTQGQTAVLNYEPVIAPEVNAPVYTPPAEPQYVPDESQYAPAEPQYAPAEPQYAPAELQYASPVEPQPEPPKASRPAQPAPQAPAAPVIPPEYKPLGAWAYFGWNLLFSIPLVGPILLLVFACGGCKNKNLRNYARSFFCGLLIAVIILVLFILVGAILGFSLAGLEGMV